MALQPFGLVTEQQVREGLRTAKVVPPDDWLNIYVPLISNEVERYLQRTLRYETGIVEWFSPSNEAYILLDRRPVHRIQEVRLDMRGGFGQLSNTFGTDTILTAGSDYYLQIDGHGALEGLSTTGTVYRTTGTWGSNRFWRSGVLRPVTRPAQGAIKVTYDGGYQTSDDESKNQMPGVVSAAIVQAAGVWFETLVSVGLMSGEGVEGYNYSRVIGMNLGDNLFASVRGMLTSLKSRRPGAGMTSPP